MKLFVGTFSHQNGRALHVFDYEVGTGGLTLRSTTDAVVNPSFLAIHPSGEVLYAVSEKSGGTGAQPLGEVVALRIAGERLEVIGRQPASGPRPCHVAVEATGRFLYVANYRGESFAVFPVGPDRAPGPATHSIHHKGSSVDPVRQQRSHPHSCTPDPGNRWLYVCDLGLDRVMIYDIAPDEGGLRPAHRRMAPVPPGAGPRHLRFHPEKPVVYVTNEMGGSITLFDWDRETGSIAPRQTVDTLPAGHRGKRWNSELAPSADGRFLYAANRGHDSIATFAIGGRGELDLVGHVPTGGRTPRHFTLDPEGKRLLVGNQDSGTIDVFDLDPESGMPSHSGRSIPVEAPTCLVFAPAEGNVQ